MNYLNEFSYHLLLIMCLFIYFSIYKLFFRRKHNSFNFNHSQLKPLLYWRFLLAFYKSNFDIYKLLSHLSDDVKNVGIFTIDLIFKRWIFVFHPQYVQELLLDTENIDRKCACIGIKGLVDDSLFSINGMKWRERRTFLNPAFRKTTSETYIPNILKHSKKLMDNLKEKNNEYLDIYPQLTKHISGIICDIILNLDESTFMKIFDKGHKFRKYIADIYMERMYNIFLWPNFIFRLTKKGRRCEDSIFFIRDLIRKEIIKRINFSDTVMNNNENVKNFKIIDLYIYSLKRKVPKMTIETIVDEVLMFIEAGSEPTSNQLSWILYEIGKHVNIQKNIQKELDEIVTSDDCCLTIENLNKMHYLDCVIKESLRMHPSIPITERFSKKEHRFGNHVFSKNSSYFILFFKLHQNSDLFPKPDIFDPNRFLPENSAGLPPFSYLPFSAGRRMCLGKYFAMLQMKIYIANILKLYNIESLPEKYHYYISGGYLVSTEPRKIIFK